MGADRSWKKTLLEVNLGLVFVVGNRDEAGLAVVVKSEHKHKRRSLQVPAYTLYLQSVLQACQVHNPYLTMKRRIGNL